jgi:glycosyltransferase involved in cell wall biosynthesis
MNVGGPAVLLSPLFNELVGPDFEHLLVTGKCPPNEVDYLLSHPLATGVVYIDEVSRAIGPMGDLIGFLKLCRIIRKFKPDIVHTHTSKAGLLGRLASFFVYPRAVRIHTFHGHVLSGYFSKPIETLFKNLERVLGLITDVPVSITYPVLEELQHLGVCRKKSWVVIHPGIAAVTDINKNTNKDATTIGWIGRFAQVKNPLLALEAFKLIEKSEPGKFNFIMAGEGELFEEAKKYASENGLQIEFTGWITNTKDFFSKIDILFLTSINEGLGLVVLEAAQNGVPTISTNVGGVSDFITNNKTGLFVKASASDFAHAAILLSHESNQRAALGKAAEKLVASDFSSTQFISKHLALYKKVSLETK